MAIPQTKYVSIKSFVGAVNQVLEHALILRLFTINPLIPPGGVLEFTDDEAVKNYFGESSEEYKRAQKYFNWVSKLFTSPTKISFARWVDAAIEFRIYGGEAAALATIKIITDGEFILNYGTDFTITNLDFSAAEDYADVADILQTAIRTLSNAAFTTANVQYNPIKKQFIIIGSSSSSTTPIIVKNTVNDTATAQFLGLLPQSINGSPGAIWAGSSLIEPLTLALTNSENKSNNFGTFVFMPTLTLDQHLIIANWMQATDFNNLYQYHILVTNITDAQNYYSALKDFAGVGITYSVFADQFEDDFSATILASINFNLPNSSQNFNFQQGNYKASVTTKILSDQLDALNINYFGQTQSAGQEIIFYQRGVLMGGTNAPRFMNIYANEQWLKNKVSAELFSYMLIAPKISANKIGLAQVQSVLEQAINTAKINGVISASSELTDDQKRFVTQITNSSTAWYQVQSLGYYLKVTIVPRVVNNVTDYILTYLLVYKKDDVINKIEGTHVLI